MKQIIYFLCFFAAANIATSQTTNITVPKTQRGVVTKLAATWCTFCGLEAWDTYKGMVNDLSSKSLVMTAHRSTSSRLYSETAEKVLNAYQPVFYQPYFFFNTKVVGEGDAATATEMKKQVDNFASATTPVAQTGLMAKYNPATRELEVTGKTEFFKTSTGEFSTGVYVVEKTVIAPQTNRGPEAQHLHVLRNHFGSTEFGFEIGQGTMMSGFFKVFSGKLKIPTNVNADNIIVASIIWQKDGNVYNILNANWTEQISSVVTSVKENQELKAAFSISPNVFQDQAKVEFNLPRAGKNVQVQAVDLKGQVVATLFSGSLPAGKQQFQLNRQQLTSKGLYFVRLLVDGQFATRQAILQ